jgi:Pentapeptide repeats (8 copies)
VEAAVANGASLNRASLNGASLNGASLNRASLNGARLNDASLNRASLNGASLNGASLDGARLTPIRDDIWAVLCSAPQEVPALRNAIAAGRIDGSRYAGDCACLVGTLAKARGCSEFQIEGLKPNGDRQAERFFLAIHVGDTPETSQISRLALQWVDEWLSNMRAAFGGETKA